MRPANLLISCVPAPTADGQALEDWLAGVVAGLSPEGAVLFRAQEADLGKGGPAAEQGASREQQVFFLGILDQSPIDAPRLAELVAEMRLLGLNPTVFRPGPLPMAHQGLANVF